jgi:hypothetical protein
VREQHLALAAPGVNVAAKLLVCEFCFQLVRLSGGRVSLLQPCHCTLVDRKCLRRWTKKGRTLEFLSPSFRTIHRDSPRMRSLVWLP